MLNYVRYGNYEAYPEVDWIGSASAIRAVIPAEMAVPVMVKKGLRFHSVNGHYDPLYGYAPKGTPLRRR